MPGSVRGPRPGPCPTDGPRTAASQSGQHGERQGPRMVGVHTQPPLPRAMSAVSWASSVTAKQESGNAEAREAAEREDKFPDILENEVLAGRTLSSRTEERIAAEQEDTFPDTFQDNVQLGGSAVKPAKMRRGWSNIVSMFGSGQEMHA
mmetsp:Transcript_80210/g.139964  ORF Transcript_80210/g.139964 Transcript_80210/m.139964 type:complete len:149 (+) Transcript_80210:98-544(+)